MKNIYAIVYSPGMHEILPTKKACREQMLVWKAVKEEAGEKVRSAMHGNAFFADDEAIVLHEYDAETKERIDNWTPKPRPERKPAEKKPRRGRVPIGA